jgi:hypothetical protein
MDQDHEAGGVGREAKEDQRQCALCGLTIPETCLCANPTPGESVTHGVAIEHACCHKGNCGDAEQWRDWEEKLENSYLQGSIGSDGMRSRDPPGLQSREVDRIRHLRDEITAWPNIGTISKPGYGVQIFGNGTHVGIIWHHSGGQHSVELFDSPIPTSAIESWCRDGFTVTFRPVRTTTDRFGGE